MSNQPDIKTLQRDNATLLLANSHLRQQQEQQSIRLLAQEQIIAQLRQQIADLQSQLEQQPPVPPAPSLPPFVKPKRAAKPVRPARSQRDPQPPQRRHLLPTTNQQFIAFAHCPTCDYQLSGHSEAWRHQVITLPPPQPLIVTDYIYLKRYCPNCQHYQTPAPGLPGIVIGQSHFGVELVAHIGWLRTVGRLPLSFIVSYLRDLYQLELSEGEVCYLLAQLAAQGEDEAAQIHQQLLGRPSLHIDETGWKVNGKSGYIWSVSNDEGLRYYYYSHSRAGAVAQKLLDGFKGVFHSDFYAGYNGCSQQRQCCWVHLLRDLHELEEEYGEEVAGVSEWIRRLRRLYEVGKWLAGRDVGQEVKERWYSKLVGKLHELALTYATNKGHVAQALSKRLLLHEQSMFTYVRVAGVVADNNQAERSIRPLAVARKISGGSRSEDGVKVRMTLHSLFGTWVAKGLNPLQECRRLLGVQTSFQPL